jgi:crotonobetainyl-CoA:carnitine CoA-transferase CaiB-like acyl-CoA transferase
VQNRPDLSEAIEQVTRTAPIGVSIEKLNEAVVPCAPINA